MIIRDKQDVKIEKYKKAFGLTGDVYLIGNIISDLLSHKRQFPYSQATTIEQAEGERRGYLLDENTKKI